MRPKFDKDGIVLYQGDCLDVMSQLPQCSIDTVITDPPYGIRFMGQAWDGADIERRARDHACTRNPRTDGRRVPRDGLAAHAGSYDLSLTGNRAYQEWCAKWAEAALRVTKPGAFLLAFGGTRTFHRLVCALEEAGWIIRDCIMWLYGSGFPKSMDISKAIDRAAGIKRNRIGISSGPNHSHYQGKRYSRKRSIRFGPVQDQPDLTAPATNAAKQWHGWGTALKPAWEPIIVAMKPLEGTFAQNAQKHGVAGLWIDGVRIPANDIRSGGFGNGKRPWQSGPVGGNTQYVGSEQGRWPANVIHDGSDEAMGPFPNVGSSRVRIEQNSQRADESQYRIKPTPGTIKDFGDTGSAARFFYCAKASRSERNAGLSGIPARKALIGVAGNTTNPKTGKPIVDIPRANHHPTVKPLMLMEYLCKLTKTPAGGTILDPFAGSGSTLIAAQNVGRKCIGIECDREYVRIAQARLRTRTAQHLKGGSSKAA